MDIDELCRIRWLVSSASELGRRNKRRGSSAATAVGMEAKDAMMMRMDLDNVFIVDIGIEYVAEREGEYIGSENRALAIEK